jgi:hypothetical protein
MGQPEEDKVMATAKIVPERFQKNLLGLCREVKL